MIRAWHLRESELYTLKMIAYYLREKRFEYFCYHLPQRFYVFYRRIYPSEREYSWNTLERAIRKLAHEYGLLEPLHHTQGGGRKGCFRPTQMFWDLAREAGGI